jgi:hypothetical protein
MITQSEQFFVEDMLFLLLILCTSNPHVFERRKTGKDAPTLPAHNVSLARRKDSCLHLIWKPFFQLFYKTVGEAFNQCISSWKHDLIVEGHAKVNIHFG